MMNCKDCEHFHIRQEPLRTPGKLWDMGLAECKKHNVVADFANETKLNRLKCVESEGNDDTV